MVDTIESEARVPGWTLIRSGNSLNYRSPNGQVIGQVAYKRVYRHYMSTGEALTDPINYKYNLPSKNISNLSQTSSSNIEQKPVFNTPTTPPDPHLNPIELPVPKPTPAGKTHGDKYNAKDIGVGVETVLILLTSIFALAVRLPEAQITEMEAKAISIPLANIIERSRYNKTIGNLVVGKGDYILLGYALYTYIDRVSTAARERVANGQPIGQVNKAENAGNNGGNSGAGGVPLHYAPQGLRGFTPPA